MLFIPKDEKHRQELLEEARFRYKWTGDWYELEYIKKLEKIKL